jgi:hypothetical protein
MKKKILKIIARIDFAFLKLANRLF